MVVRGQPSTLCRRQIAAPTVILSSDIGGLNYRGGQFHIVQDAEAASSTRFLFGKKFIAEAVFCRTHIIKKHPNPIQAVIICPCNVTTK